MHPRNSNLDINRLRITNCSVKEGGENLDRNHALLSVLADALWVEGAIRNADFTAVVTSKNQQPEGETCPLARRGPDLKALSEFPAGAIWRTKLRLVPSDAPGRDITLISAWLFPARVLSGVTAAVSRRVSEVRTVCQRPLLSGRIIFRMGRI
ncbi:hypothetical protein EXN66_Car016149 [Channa argus]|uniref:Uncharacterized protein n=1 Tax=Channa argus TaxID=215402 RepID=A0A6G1QD34_CHAAH|nr:hypothetical protein EXN66_Car016149 [Channa argus]